MLMREDTTTLPPHRLVHTASFGSHRIVWFTPHRLVHAARTGSEPQLMQSCGCNVTARDSIAPNQPAELTSRRWRKRAPASMNLHQLARTCTSWHELAPASMNLHQLARTCRGQPQRHKGEGTCHMLRPTATVLPLATGASLPRGARPQHVLLVRA
jgi:hypothetical protein